jgi:hypothetical protein
VVKRCWGPLALVLLLATAGGGRAGFVFDVGNDDIKQNSSLKAPYANLTITGDVATGKLIFDITLVGNNSGKFGDFGFNFDKANVHASDFTIKVTGTGGNTSSWGRMGPGQLGVFGSFDEIIGTSSGLAADRLTSVKIELNFKAGKFDEALVSNFVVGNDPDASAKDSGYYFAERFFPTTGNTTGDPDFIGIAVPEPAPFALLASGGFCLGVVLVVRRRKPTLA